MSFAGDRLGEDEFRLGQAWKWRDSEGRCLERLSFRPGVVGIDCD